MIQHTIDGQLYQLIDIKFENVGEIYWCEQKIDKYLLAEAYRNYQETNDCGIMDFEQYWNIIYPDVYIHRVFIKDIYI